jgi:hypothetical protein
VPTRRGSHGLRVTKAGEFYRNVLAKNRSARACLSRKLKSEGPSDPRPHWRRSRRLQGGNHVKGENLSKAKTLKGGLAGAAALLMLSACVSPDEVADLDRRVSTLESQVTAAQSRAAAAETRASLLEMAANQCAATCQDVRARLPR